MPLRNRVTPFGDLIATPERGLVYGNRGCLHDGAGRFRRRYATRRWIACRLEFRGWNRSPLMQPGRFTELFFLDEATAFAATRTARRYAATRRYSPRPRWSTYSAADGTGSSRCCILQRTSTALGEEVVSRPGGDYLGRRPDWRSSHDHRSGQRLGIRARPPPGPLLTCRS